MRTPADLKAARLRLGLSHREAAQLIGWPPEGDVSQMERAKQNVCWQGYADALCSLESYADDAMYDAMAAWDAGQSFLVFYSNDEDFAGYDPKAFMRARFASVHRSTMIAAQGESRRRGRTMTLVEFSRGLYHDPYWGGGFVSDWAKHRLTEIEQRPGLPPLKLVRRSA